MKRTLVPKSLIQNQKNPTEVEIHEFYQSAISSALRKLLQEKHLYQSVMVEDASLIDDLSGADVEDTITSALLQLGNQSGAATSNELHQQEVRQRFTKRAIGFRNGPWKFNRPPAGKEKEVIEAFHFVEAGFELPSIKITCSQCEAILPAHNPGHKHCTEFPLSIDAPINDGVTQVFSFPYQCQSCVGEPIVFLVHRCGPKLTLVGRSHFESPQMPDYFPKRLRKYYGNAVISSNCNQPLAAVFYLRTMIEQHMRIATNESEKISGDELADKYARTLPPRFTDDLPSLKKCYQNLSIAIHAADENSEIFHRELAKIDGHFDTLHLLQKLAKIHR